MLVQAQTLQLRTITERKITRKKVKSTWTDLKQWHPINIWSSFIIFKQHQTTTLLRHWGAMRAKSSAGPAISELLQATEDSRWIRLIFCIAEDGGFMFFLVFSGNGKVSSLSATRSAARAKAPSCCFAVLVSRDPKSWRCCHQKCAVDGLLKGSSRMVDPRWLAVGSADAPPCHRWSADSQLLWTKVGALNRISTVCGCPSDTRKRIRYVSTVRVWLRESAVHRGTHGQNFIVLICWIFQHNISFHSLQGLHTNEWFGSLPKVPCQIDQFWTTCHMQA